MDLPYLETHLADHCNLECKGCSHFSPLVKESKFTEVDSFQKDLKRIGQLFENITLLRLMGGEPILHPRIIDLLEIARSHFPRSNIVVVTNGVLLSNQMEEFWNTCRSNSIKLNITRYPIKLDIEKIEGICQRYTIEVKVSKPRRRFVKYLNQSGNSKPDQSFRKCQIMFKCPTLQDGKIYPCCVPPYIGYFNDYFSKNIPVDKCDYLDIHNENISGDDILDFLNKPIPMCRWCLEKRPVFDWGISKKEMEEWIGAQV